MLAPFERDADGVDAAHLAGTDADRPQLLGEHDRVRGHVLADRPGEEQIRPLGLVRRSADDLHRLPRVGAGVALLDEQTAKSTPDVQSVGNTAGSERVEGFAASASSES